MNPSYFERVLRIDLLGRAEESALAQRWRHSGDLAARNSLVQAHLRLVPPIARRYYRPGASLGDLIAEGNVGLLRAAAKFEPERGSRFATYATYWIRACVAECANRNSEAPLRMPRVLRKVRRESIRAATLLGAGAEARALMAERLALDAGALEGLMDLLLQRRVSFESLGPEWRGTDGPLCSTEGTPEQTMLDEIERRSRETSVRDAVAALSAREQRIVAVRLMADEDAVLTLRDLGREFGVSRERVRQLEMNVKRKLATQLCSQSDQSRVRTPRLAA